MKTPLFFRVLQDTIADTTRIRVSPDEVTTCCLELAKKVRLRYEPDLVVAISTGGFLPGELIATILNLPIAHIVIRRDIHIKRMYNKDLLPLRWIMSIYHHFLFHTVKPTILKGIDQDIYGKKILLVDDSLHTGTTIDIAIEYLKKAGATEIKTATLTHVLKRKPDFSILVTGNYSFPWSKDFDPSLD